MNDEKPMTKQSNEASAESSQVHHPTATGLGAAAGGIAGGALGKSIGGRLGAAVGGVAGAIAGGMVADALTDVVEEATNEIGLGLGADTKAIELPQHYSWEELQALSKSQ